MAEKIVGRQPVLEALKAGQSIEKILVQHGTRGSAVDAIYRLAKQRGIPIMQSSKERFRELSGDEMTQGVIALVGATVYVEIDDILGVAKNRNEAPFILILDEIEDPHNLGALMRTAECAGVHGVVIPKHHSAPVSHAVAKVSAGATAHLSVARVTNIVRAIQELKGHDSWIVGADMSGGKSYFEVDYREPVAIVIGNEGKGIRRLVKEECDFLVRIPLYGKIGSLNASVAGGLLMFEAARQRHGG